MPYDDYLKLVDYLAAEQDDQYFDTEYEDPTDGTDFEGGYRATRPRHLRTSYRRKWMTGWSNLTRAEMRTLEQFYRDVHAGADIWIWVNPHDDTQGPYVQNPGEVFVRFAGPIKFTPVNYGSATLYDCQISIEEI